MTEIFKTSEYTPWVGSLDDQDWTFVKGELSQQINARREIRNGKEVCVLDPGQYVGIVVLPSGNHFEVAPKVPVENLFYMISIAFRLDPFRKETATFERLDDLLAAIARVFAGLVEERIAEGLYRSYVECSDNLRYVRGRIDFTQDLRRNLLSRHRTHCTYTDFTWDIEENQILRQVAHLLSGWGFDPALRLRLSRLDNALAEVSPATLPASAVSRFRYDRFNDGYRHPHQLCRLFLEGASLSEKLGVWDSRTFLVDMNKLFELFVTENLTMRAANGTTVSAQVELRLAEGNRIPIRPDIMIEKRGQTLVVVDCKYKRLTSEALNHDDYYQVLAYCIATRSPNGLIVYPRQEFGVERQARIRNTDISVGQCAIDCSVVIDDFEKECDRFAEYVFSMAEDAEHQYT
jgi:5-methylcytosine-specific restriction enzyme subunit McrC